MGRNHDVDVTTSGELAIVVTDPPTATGHVLILAQIVEAAIRAAEYPSEDASG